MSKKVKPVSRFVYTSVCCDKPAKKPAVKRSPDDIKENKFSECGLGHWRCTRCEKNCKVVRSRVKETDGTEAGA